MKSKAPKVRCKNCGEWTQFPKTSIGDRDKKQWCGPCYSTWMRGRYENSGKWKDDTRPRELYSRNSGTSGIGKEDDGEPTI